MIDADGTMLAALFGDFTVHQQRNDHVATSDAFSLFVARSSAMGWLADTGAADSAVWGMNEAGYQAHRGQQSSPPPPAGWFQVALSGSGPNATPLPTQALLSCASDVMDRIGTLELSSVRLTLPLHSLAHTSGPRESVDDHARTGSRHQALGKLVQDAGWFSDLSPAARTPITIRLTSTTAATDGTAARIAGRIGPIQQEVFRCDPVATAAGPEDGVVLTGMLAEWSPAALGWLAAFLAEMCAHTWPAHSLTVRISRSP